MTTQELKTYFATKPLPQHPIKINSFSTITDPQAFLETQLYALEANPNHKPNDSCRLRLIELREWLERDGDEK
jgi:hypothetical protein